MYTVLIVDKKKQMFNVYKNMLHWDKYNFEVISFADTIDDAISYYREYRHDLIISDMELKDGNGIELFLQLKQFHTNCHMIICSYDTSYETVRYALRCGCIDYLNKASLKNAEIIENLEWITGKYMKKYGVVSVDWHEELQRILGLIRDKQSFQMDELYHLLKREELKLLTNQYYILFFRMDDVKETFWHHRFEDRMELNDVLKNVIDTQMCTFPIPNLMLFSKMHAGIILIEKCPFKQLLTLANNVIKYVREKQDISLSIFISDVCKGYEMFYESYASYSNALFSRFYMGNEQVVRMGELPVFKGIELYQFTYKEVLLHHFNMCDFKEINPLLKEMLLTMRSLTVAPEDVIQYCRTIISLIERQELKKGIRKDQELFDQFQGVFLRIETMDMLEVYMRWMMEECIVWITKSSKFLYSDIVMDIIQYVNDHLHEKITLQEISNTIHRTPIHISRVFKKQMDENLMYYINRCKMEKAAILLVEQKQMKVKEIAEKLGIDDQLYFNKVFRKYYQVSPRAYRKER